MKTLLTLTVIFTYFAAVCQAPEGLNYQAVVRNTTGAALPNQAISVKFNIHHLTTTGTIVYAETQSTTTNQFGMVNLIIGQGAVLTGQLDSINWASGPFYCEVLIDLTGGGNYQSMGIAQLMSVPYALFANNGAQSIQGYHNVTNIAFNTGLTFATIDSVIFTLTAAHRVYFQADVSNWGMGTECTFEIQLSFDGVAETHTLVLETNRPTTITVNNQADLTTSWMATFTPGTHVVRLLGAYTGTCEHFMNPHLNVLTLGN